MHVCAENFDKKASDIHLISMCVSIDGVLHPWINGRELSHWMKRGAPVEFHRDHDTSLFEGNMNMTDFDTTYPLL